MRIFSIYNSQSVLSTQKLIMKDLNAHLFEVYLRVLCLHRDDDYDDEGSEIVKKYEKKVETCREVAYALDIVVIIVYLLSHSLLVPLAYLK